MKKNITFLLIFLHSCKGVHLDVNDLSMGGKSPIGLLEVSHDRDFGIRKDNKFCSGFLIEDGDFVTNSSCIVDSNHNPIKAKEMRLYFKVPSEPDTHQFKVMSIHRTSKLKHGRYSILIPEDKSYLAQTYGTIKIETNVPSLNLLSGNIPVHVLGFDDLGDRLTAKLKIQFASLQTQTLTKSILSTIGSSTPISPTGSDPVSPTSVESELTDSTLTSPTGTDFYNVKVMQEFSMVKTMELTESKTASGTSEFKSENTKQNDEMLRFDSTHSGGLVLYEVPGTKEVRAIGMLLEVGDHSQDARIQWFPGFASEFNQ